MRLADSIRESRRARIWRCLRGKELTDIESGKETGCMGRADLSLPEQRSRREIVVLGKPYLRSYLLQMAAKSIRIGPNTAGALCRNHSTASARRKHCGHRARRGSRDGDLQRRRCTNCGTGVAGFTVMLSDFTGAEKVYIACGYTDLRRGIDGLAAMVQQEFSLDPFTNTLFLFCGRRRDRIKALYWEGNGFVLLL